MQQFRPNFDDSRDGKRWDRNRDRACSANEPSADEIQELRELIGKLERNNEPG
jgi:hypothetical protein